MTGIFKSPLTVFVGQERDRDKLKWDLYGSLWKLIKNLFGYQSGISPQQLPSLLLSHQNTLFSASSNKHRAKVLL